MSNVNTGDLGARDMNVESLCWGTGDGDEAGYRDNMVGKIIGGEDKYNLEKESGDDDEDAPEPLALLAIHAAMHMLFLPQFTCDFYEEDEEDGGDSVSSRESTEQRKKAGFLEKRAMKMEKEAEAKALKEDEEMKREVGLPNANYIAEGIILRPKPACIVWAAGCGIKNKKVRK